VPSVVSELQKMVYALPAGPAAREPSTQLKRGVGDGPGGTLRVAPVVADSDPLGDGLSEPPVTEMTEIKFESPGRGPWPSLFK